MNFFLYKVVGISGSSNKPKKNAISYNYGYLNNLYFLAMMK